MAKRPNAPFQRPSLPARLAAIYRRWPRWARIGVPVVVVLIVIGAVAGGEDGDGEEVQAEEAATTTTTFTTSAEITLEEAVDQASDVAPPGVSEAVLTDLIEVACDGLTGEDQEPDDVAADIADKVGEAVASTNVNGTVEAVGVGAEALCPTAVASAPQFLNDVVEQVRATTTTTTTSTTTTTAPPPPPTTAAPPPPPPPPPPTTAAPAPSGVHYDNCSEARAAGAAPVHRGDPGYGRHIDRDGDGVGCES